MAVQTGRAVDLEKDLRDVALVLGVLEVAYREVGVPFRWGHVDLGQGVGVGQHP